MRFISLVSFLSLFNAISLAQSNTERFQKKMWRDAATTLKSTESNFKTAYKNKKLKPADLKKLKQAEADLKLLTIHLEKELEK